LEPEIRIDTTELSAQSAVDRVIEVMAGRGIIKLAAGLQR
jgi:hypothetical protein